MLNARRNVQADINAVNRARISASDKIVVIGQGSSGLCMTIAARALIGCEVAAVDNHDSVGVLDQYDFNTRFFTEIERFERHLEKLRRGPEENRAHYVSICSPNYLHDAHCRLALRAGANVICEKPLVISPWNLDALKEIENETGGRINAVLQLRTHPALLKLREEIR